MTKNSLLKNRCIISIVGEDRKTFLQGLLTNDINKVSETQAIYTFMLSPQGRFLYDFFIIEKDGKFLLDCSQDRVDEIVQKFSFYKLRSKVEIRKELDLIVVSRESLVVSEGEIGFVDPRNSQMGYRGFILQLADCHPEQSAGSLATCREPILSATPEILRCAQDDKLVYNFQRINLKLPDDSDLTYDKSFPLEFGFDNFNAIDYKKGCYVGQETTARTHYKGTIRKKIFLVEVLDCQQMEKGAEIEAEDKKYGEILSSVFHQNKLLTLALIKNLDNEGKEINLENLKLTALGKAIKIIK
ncbi:MAG: hypothetical protein V4612_00545 [Pseudomonadota bacterium]